MNERVIAHVGFHKTGSTLLQKKIFIGAHGFYAPWPIRYHVDQIIRANPYLDLKGHLQRTYAREFQNAWNQSLVPVISHETLLGYPFDGGNPYATTSHVEQLISAFPDLTVAIVVREQVSMLASLYKHSISGNHTWNPASFLPERPTLAKQFAMEFLEYSWPLLRLRSILGHDRVKVIPYEWLRSSPESFARAFEQLSGSTIPTEALTSSVVNPGLTALEADIKRFGNRLLPNSPKKRAIANSGLWAISQHGARILGHRLAAERERHLREYIRTRIGRYYAESNATVAETFDLDLESLGYDVR